MEKEEFYYREQVCTDTFNSLGQVYNACTSENHPLIFITEEDFKTGMSILGISALMNREIQIYAFQLMSNHIHLVIGGDEQQIMSFFNYFVDRLEYCFPGRLDLKQFKLKLFQIEDIAYFRNSIVYVNRNGFVVNSNVTPFSYPWGTSICFFQPIVSKYFKLGGMAIGTRKIRNLMHTKNADSLSDTLIIDGYVPPLEFCKVSMAELVFRDAKQYFYMISRNVETYSKIAKLLGESIYYNDNDLYIAATKIAKEQFESKDLNTLTAGQKIELAKQLHFEYNAGDKQLQRMLKINENILKSLF